MIQSSNDYSKFKMCLVNRTKVIQTHVDFLTEVINKCDKTHLNPITVDSNLTIINGQHRFLACKKLNKPIYYMVDEAFQMEEMPAMNTSKQWGLVDYHWFWLNEKKEEYIKLQEFMDKFNMPLEKTISLRAPRGRNVNKDFKDGTFIFNFAPSEGQMKRCFDTINIIKEAHGGVTFLNNKNFWRSLNTFFLCEEFSWTVWEKNARRLVGRFRQCVTLREYLRLFCEIYNYRLQDGQIDLKI